MPRTTDCDRATRQGRLAKANQFMAAADIVLDLTDDDPADLGAAYVTLVVHAGIAAADVICCARLGRYSRGENHNEAIDLLGSIDKKLANDLSVLLGMKTRAGYSALPITQDDQTKAGRAVDRLMSAARLSR